MIAFYDHIVWITQEGLRRGMFDYSIEAQWNTFLWWITDVKEEYVKENHPKWTEIRTEYFLDDD